MRFKASNFVVAVTLFSSLVMPASVAAQETSSKDHKSNHQQYKLIDLGTFGGPASSFNAGGVMLNNRGFGVGASETPVSDPSNANGFPCGPGSFIYHGFEMQNGVPSTAAAPWARRNTFLTWSLLV